MSSEVPQSDGGFAATIWSIRLSVRTTDFHSVKTSSTLV